MKRLQRTPLIVLSCAALAVAAGFGMCATSPRAVAERERAAALEEARSRQVDSTDHAGRAGGLEPVSSPAPAPAERTATTLEVEAVRAERRATATTAEIRGILRPAREVVLAAEVEGRVVALETEEHSHVEAGDPLVELDPTLLAAAVRRFEAALLRTRSAWKLAEIELARQRDLRERAVASAAELDRAENEERSTYALFAETQASLADARALPRRGFPCLVLR